MFRRFFGVLILLLSLTLSRQNVHAQIRPSEEISEFSSIIDIQQDTSLEITETLKYVTTQEHHGIFRYIPTKKQTENGTRRYRISVISITNELDKSYQYESSTENDNLTLKIGDPDKTFTGERTYVLRYRIEHALDTYSEYDELYWDITGEGWNFPVQTAKVTVHSPWADMVESRCFTGAYGSNIQACQTQTLTPSELTISTTESLQPQENFTIAAKLQQPNSLIFPDKWERLGINWFIWPLIAALPLPALIMLALWWKKGRDFISLSPHVLIESESAATKQRGIFQRFQAPFIYEPFQDLSPAQVEAISLEKITPQALVAEIIDLARKKYLKIVPQEKKQLLWKTTEYRFEKIKNTKTLPVHQSYLLQSLFGTKESINLKDLKGSFYTHIAPWQKKVWESVTKDGYFAASPTAVKQKYFLLAGLLIALGWINAIILEIRLLTTVPWAILAMIPVTVISLIIPPFLPQKTVKGWRVQQKASGLKKTIQRGKWREEIKEKHLFIEEIFPFAVAFGVVNKLAKDLDDLGERPPEYIGNQAFAASQLSNFTNSLVQSTTTNLTYNPSSGSGSGSSGFSSGGGFSGGGGGGGGGGSW